MTGLLILGLAVLVAVGLGVHRSRTDGRFTATPTTPVPRVERAAPVTPIADRAGRAPGRGRVETTWTQVATALPTESPGERATLVQFSSAFCAPCRTTRAVLADVAAREPGVRHVEVDAEAHLELVRALDVRHTPTTLVLDADGRELHRAAGAPRRDQVLAALAVTR